jgi:hypothetical protein
MSQKRHEKDLQREAKMSRRAKQRGEARRQHLAAVSGSMAPGQAMDTEIAVRLGFDERIMLGRHLQDEIAAGGTDEKIRFVKYQLSSLYGKVGV